MENTKSNGQAGHAVPAVVTAPPQPVHSPPGSPFDQVKAIMEHEGRKKYAEGYRAATTIIARCVGQLDGEAKAKLTKALDRLEGDLHGAEQAAL